MASFEETTYQINRDVMVTAGLQDRISSNNPKRHLNSTATTKLVLFDDAGSHFLVSEDVISFTYLVNVPISIRFRAKTNELVKSQKVLHKDKLLLTYGNMSINDLCCVGWACESINNEMSVVEIQFSKGTAGNTQILNG